jgi:SAM-dependent methyltransferase
MPDSALGLSRQRPEASRFWEHPAWAEQAAGLLGCLRPHVPERVFRYFANERRVRPAIALCRRHAPEGARVLNLGSGCGLLDLALEFSGFGQVTAVDCDQRVAAAYRSAIDQGILTRTRFILGSWGDIDRLVEPEFDLILAWDALYYPGSDLFDLLPRLASLLPPSGVLIFDLRDARVPRVFGPLCRVLTNRSGGAHYLWHDLRAVRAALRPCFEIVASGPKLHSERWQHRLLKAIPAYALGLSVGRYFVLSRRGGRTQ